MIFRLATWWHSNCLNGQPKLGGNHLDQMIWWPTNTAQRHSQFGYKQTQIDNPQLGNLKEELTRSGWSFGLWGVRTISCKKCKCLPLGNVLPSVLPNVFPNAYTPLSLWLLKLLATWQPLCLSAASHIVAHTVASGDPMGAVQCGLLLPVVYTVLECSNKSKHFPVESLQQSTSSKSIGSPLAAPGPIGTTRFHWKVSKAA